MNWKNKYGDKIVTADEAVKIIQSDSKVIIGHAAAEPVALTRALVRRAGELKNVELFQMLNMGNSGYTLEQYKESFHYNGPFLSAPTREAVKAGRGDYIPMFFHEIPRLVTDIVRPDYALIQVSGPDEEGNCSYGLSVDYTEAATRNQEVKVILQINNNMPFTNGTTIHLDRASYIVEENLPIITLAPPNIGSIEEKIGKNVSSLIEDGDTLQLGIGAIPDAVLLFLDDKKNLGIHTEMFSDGVVKLAEAGVINNTKKSLHPGKFVSSFLMGTQKLYDFVHRNLDLLMLPVDYVNDPFVIAQNDNMISINTCMQIDLYGQINGETIGNYQYSAVGGQVDFFRGVKRSKGGKAIMALPATAKKDTISKIVIDLDDGSAVTTSRYDVEYVVTEYGVVNLYGLNLRERAKALIEIAHPNFREKLEKEAWEAGKLR